MTKQLIVIGGGLGGSEAARSAARAGAKVTLVTDGPIGGRAGWHSLLPSKVWLAAAEMASGLALPEDILARLQATRTQWNEQQQEALLALGVAIVSGAAAFVGADSLEVTQDGITTRLAADRFVVATGSVPVFPAGLKPDGRKVIAPRLMSQLNELPDSMVVIGGGSTGCEFAHLFNVLGVNVHWVIDAFGVLPTYHPDAGRFLMAALMERGVSVYMGQVAETIDRSGEGVVVILSDGTRLSAGMAFAAVGRQPDVSRLQLDRAGIDSENWPLELDEFGRSSNPAVYVIGDAAGSPMVANKAMAQGRIAALHALGIAAEPFDFSTLLLATYTRPEVAQIGDVAAGVLAHVRLPYDQALKPWLLNDTSGFVDIAYESSSGRVTGGIAVGEHAAEALAPLVVALRAQLRIDDLAALYSAHPTLSELVFAAARLAG